MVKPLKNILIFLPAMLVSMPAWAQLGEDSSGYWHDSWGWGHMAFGGLTMAAFWGGLILLIILALRWTGGNTGGRAAGNSALEILKERFARGEIEKQEYEDRKRPLSN